MTYYVVQHKTDTITTWTDCAPRHREKQLAIDDMVMLEAKEEPGNPVYKLFEGVDDE